MTSPHAGHCASFTSLLSTVRGSGFTRKVTIYPRNNMAKKLAARSSSAIALMKMGTVSKVKAIE